jgi:hypothetical protein
MRTTLFDLRVMACHQSNRFGNKWSFREGELLTMRSASRGLLEYQPRTTTEPRSVETLEEQWWRFVQWGDDGHYSCREHTARSQILRCLSSNKSWRWLRSLFSSVGRRGWAAGGKAMIRIHRNIASHTTAQLDRVLSMSQCIREVLSSW